MKSKYVLDIKGLLKPISRFSVTGKDLRTEMATNSLYYQIKDARNVARTFERDNIVAEQINDVNQYWRKVITLGTEIISKHSKDLEITAWLIEALLRVYGFVGLTTGFYFTRKLIEKYWNELYPQTDDEDGVVARIYPLIGLNGEDNPGALIDPISKVNLINGNAPDSFNLWQFQQAQFIEKLTDTNQKLQKIENGAITMSNIIIAAKATAKSYYVKLHEQIDESVNEYHKLVKILELRCGNEAPPSSNILNKLTECLDCVGYIMRILGTQIKKDIAKDKEMIKINKQASNNKKVINNKTRSQVLQSILNAADYFRLNEPHSPIPFILERAVKWGEMKLPELLHELIVDEKARNQVCDLAGIKSLSKNFN